MKRCIQIVHNNQTKLTKEYVPWRDSLLTKLFGDYFNGGGKAAMIINISSLGANFIEMKSVLTFASTAKRLKIPNLLNLSNPNLFFFLFKKIFIF